MVQKSISVLEWCAASMFYLFVLYWKICFTSFWLKAIVSVYS